MDSCKPMHSSLNYGIRGKRSANVYFTGKGTDCQEVEMICPDQAMWSAHRKSRLEPKPPSSGLILLYTPPLLPVNILATWLYFRGQFLKEIRNDLFLPSDVKIRKLCRIAKPSAFKECMICCETPTAKVSSGTVCLLQSWWHCFHTGPGDEHVRGLLKGSKTQSGDSEGWTFIGVF